MKLAAVLFVFAAAVSAQDTTANPLFSSSKMTYEMAKNYILRSADKIPEEMWSFQPTKEVWTVAEVFAHIADGQYWVCGMAVEGKSVDKGVIKSAKTRAEILPALKDAFAYCDAAYTKLTDAQAAEIVPFFGGRKITRLSAMEFNSAHNWEHYGNLITYMRLKGIVPPSSEPRPPAAKKK